MTRTLAASVNSYLSEPVIDWRILAEITFSNTTMRLHTGVGSLMVGATHYDGLGTLGGIERVSESSDFRTSPVKMWLSAVDSVALSEAVGETLFGKEVVLYRCLLNNGAVVNTAERWYKGQIGPVEVYRGDPERGNFIEIGLQTRIERKRKPSYYSAEDLSLTYSGDTFFDYLDQVSQHDALWGQKPTRFSGYQPYRSGPPVKGIGRIRIPT